MTSLTVLTSLTPAVNKVNGVNKGGILGSGIRIRLQKKSAAKKLSDGLMKVTG